MKGSYSIMIFGMLLATQLFAQSKSETITKSIEVKHQNIEFWFCACNINGNVDVEAYDGKTVEVTVEKRVNGRNEADVNLGMEELQLKILEGSEFVRLSMNTPNQQLSDKADPLQCGWDWNDRNEKRDYWYTIDYKIKVPKGISVKLSTINKGDVFAKGVRGNVYAANVNGDVTLKGIEGDIKATTVNGKVEVSYIKMPNEFGTFSTVNGDIEIFVPNTGSGVFNFQSQWGEVYSDLDFSAKLTSRVTKTSAVVAQSIRFLILIVTSLVSQVAQLLSSKPSMGTFI